MTIFNCSFSVKLTGAFIHQRKRTTLKEIIFFWLSNWWSLNIRPTVTFLDVKPWLQDHSFKTYLNDSPILLVQFQLAQNVQNASFNFLRWNGVVFFPNLRRNWLKLLRPYTLNRKLFEKSTKLTRNQFGEKTMIFYIKIHGLRHISPDKALKGTPVNWTYATF